MHYARLRLALSAWTSPLLSRRVLKTTETELRLIAAAASIGLNSKPNEG
jgi:hypothetical protein